VWLTVTSVRWLILLGGLRRRSSQLNGTRAEATMTKAQKLLTAFKLHDLGVEMKKMQLKRKNPHATPEELQMLYSQWVRSRRLSNPLR